MKPYDYFTINPLIASPILIHIPHSSTLIPDDMSDDYLLDEDELYLEAKSMADLYTDELFHTLFEKHGGLRLDVSRIFLDVERFRDDAKEIMAKKGMGLAYSKTSKDKDLRTLTYKENILTIYDAYHEAFETLVEQKLKEHGFCLIIDCHSFPALPQGYQEVKTDPSIEICLGYDEFHNDAIVLEKIKKHLSAYAIKENNPYKGSIVPLKYYEKDARVKSIMIELNRALYMDHVSFEKTKDFDALLGTLGELEF